MGGKGEVRKRTGNWVCPWLGGRRSTLAGVARPSAWSLELPETCHVSLQSRNSVSKVLRHFMALPVVSKGKVKISNSNGFQVS